MSNRTRTIKSRSNRSNRSNRRNCLARHIRKQTQTGGGIGRLAGHALSSFSTLKQRFKQKLRHLPGIRRFTLKKSQNITDAINTLYGQIDAILYPKQQKQIQPGGNNNRSISIKLPDWEIIGKLDNKGKTIWPFDAQTAHIILDEIFNQWNDLPSMPRHSQAQPEGWAYNRVSTVYTKLGIFVKINCKDTQSSNIKHKYYIFYYVKQDRQNWHVEFDSESDIMNAWPTKVRLPPQIDFIIGLKDDPKLRNIPITLSMTDTNNPNTIANAIKIIMAYLNKELFTAVPIYKDTKINKINDLNPKIHPISIDTIKTIVNEFNGYTQNQITNSDFNSDIYSAFRILGNAVLDRIPIYIYNKPTDNEYQLTRLTAEKLIIPGISPGIDHGMVNYSSETINKNSNSTALFNSIDKYSVIIGAKYIPSIYFPYCNE
jgi:hypothetical protein